MFACPGSCHFFRSFTFYHTGCFKINGSDYKEIEAKSYIFTEKNYNKYWKCWPLGRVYIWTQMRTRRAKMKQMFGVDMLKRRGKQHSAVRRMFGKEPNTIPKLLVLRRDFAYDTFRCRVYSLPQWMPNSVQMYHTFCLTSLLHALFTFAFWCKPALAALQVGARFRRFLNTFFSIFLLICLIYCAM